MSGVREGIYEQLRRMIGGDPFLDCDLVKRLNERKKPGLLSFFDLDGSAAAGTPQERLEARELAEELGAVVFDSARTPGLMMTSTSRENSRKHGYTRGKPLCGFSNGRRCYVPLEEIDAFKGHLDPHAICSFGVGNYVRKTTEEGPVYFIDPEYDLLLGGSHTLKGGSWKDTVMDFLKKETEGAILDYLAPIEFKENYEKKVTDVEPLPYRIQLQFRSVDEFWNMGPLAHWFLPFQNGRNSEHRDRNGTIRRMKNRIAVVNESRPDEGAYVFYIIPRYGTKGRAIEHKINRVRPLLRKNPSILIVGDTCTDLRAGLLACDGLDVTFILSGKARITDHLIGEKRGEPFAGTDLTWASEGLVATERPGFYEYQAPATGGVRLVVIGDEGYPGTIGAGTIVPFLKELHL